MNKTQTSNSLTSGPILTRILQFTIPIVLGNLFQNMYNLADTVIVGRLLGLSSLAAVGATGAVNFLVIGFVSGTSAGMTIPVAQRFGAEDYSSMRRYVSNSVYLAVLMSLILTPLMALNTGLIMRWMQTPADIIAESSLYIAVIFAGIPATFLYNTAAGITRALGDSKTPLYFLIFSSLLNVTLDIVSIALLHMDVRGPALATVLSQLISGFLCVLYMRKKFTVLKMDREDLRPDGRKCGVLLSTGVPMGLQYSITAIGSVILQSSVNTLGSNAVAAVTVGSRINMMVGNCEMDSLGTAMATYVGQNYGAGNYERIRLGVRKALHAGFVYDVIALGIMIVFGMSLERLFVTGTGNAEVLMMARRLTLTIACSYAMLCILSVLRFSLQGLGYSYIALLSGVAEMIARTIIGLVVVPRTGFAGVCFGNALAWLMADVTLFVCWVPIIRQVKRRLTT